MKINFKQPKYVLPLIILPFLCLFFYVWNSGSNSNFTEVKDQEGLNANVGSVSAVVKNKRLKDKLDAYRSTFKNADGLSAVAVIPNEQVNHDGLSYDDKPDHQQRIDSLQRLIRPKPNRYEYRMRTSSSVENALIDDAVQKVHESQNKHTTTPAVQPDPLTVFRQQMSIMDSVARQNDPQWREEQLKLQQAKQKEHTRKEMVSLSVTKAGHGSEDFNTILATQDNSMIGAVIDENVTGYAGSRIRLKLLSDIKAGSQLVPKDSYLYAQITGFSEQRVSLAVNSILSNGQILPVKLLIYDTDGLPGLYVPQSAFREFTKDLGGNSIQGVTLDGGTGTNQFMMSSIDKLFQSTSAAIAGIIRKNKARLKFNTQIYLMDPEAIHNNQKIN